MRELESAGAETESVRSDWEEKYRMKMVRIHASS